MPGIVNKGDLLIAGLSLSDPNFNQTVVLVCEHKVEEGTYGLVLNRPMPTPQPLADDFPDAVANTFTGGPVQGDTLQILHKFGHFIHGCHEVLPGLWIGGNPDELRAALSNGIASARDCRFFLGFSGWDSDQLASEFDMNAWIRVSGDPDLIMNTDPERIWTEAIRLQAVDKPMYRHYPVNPITN